MKKAPKLLVLILYAVVLLISLAGINGFVQAINARPGSNWFRADYWANSFIPMTLLCVFAICVQFKHELDWVVFAGFLLAGALLFMSAVNHAVPERAAPFAIAHVIAAISVAVVAVYRVRRSSSSRLAN
jgi:hypothetical protein